MLGGWSNRCPGDTISALIGRARRPFKLREIRSALRRRRRSGVRSLAALHCYPRTRWNVTRWVRLPRLAGVCYRRWLNRHRHRCFSLRLVRQAGSGWASYAQSTCRSGRRRALAHRPCWQFRRLCGAFGNLPGVHFLPFASHSTRQPDQAGRRHSIRRSSNQTPKEFGAGRCLDGALRRSLRGAGQPGATQATLPADELVPQATPPPIFSGGTTSLTLAFYAAGSESSLPLRATHRWFGLRIDPA